MQTASGLTAAASPNIETEDKEKNEGLFRIKDTFLNAINIAQVRLQYFELYENETICQLFYPEISLETIRNWGAKGLHDVVQFSKKILNNIYQMTLTQYKQIWPFKDLAYTYNYLRELKLFHEFVRDDVETQNQYWSRDISQVPTDLKQLKFQIYSDIVSFLEKNIKLIEPMTEPHQKAFWDKTVVLKIESANDGIMKCETRTKLNEFSIKINHFKTSLLARLNTEKRTEMNELVKKIREDIAQVENKITELALSNHETILTGLKAKRKATQDRFYQLYDCFQKLIELGKEFTNESKDIEENIIKRKLDDEKLRQFKAEQQRKRDNYKQSVAKENEKRQTERKEIIRRIKETENNISFEMSKITYEKLLKLSLEDQNVILKVLQHTTNISEKAVHRVLLKLGFIIEPIKDNGFNFKIGKLSAAYHKQRDAQAGIFHPDFISKLRKILWSLGLTQELIRSLIKGQEIGKPKKGLRGAISKPKSETKSGKAAAPILHAANSALQNASANSSSTSNANTDVSARNSSQSKKKKKNKK